MKKSKSKTTWKKLIKSVHSFFYYRLRSVKYLWQKLTRGYSDYDLYDLRTHLVRYIYPRIRDFKKAKRLGHPIFDGDKKFLEFKKSYDKTNHLFPEDSVEEAYWVHVLEKIEWSMKYAINDFVLDLDYEFILPVEERIKFKNTVYKQYQEGMSLFAKYLENLWD